MQHLPFKGAVFLALMVCPMIIRGDPGIPPIQGDFSQPIIQEEPIDDTAYPAYCDSLTAHNSLRLNSECYHWYTYSGFRVAVSRPDMRRHQAAHVGLLLDVVRAQLTTIELRLPLAAAEKLRATAIMLTDVGSICPIACYTPGQDAVVIRIDPFDDGSTYAQRSPVRNTMLHELAHAYHFEHIPNGYDNQCIKDLYQKAVDGGQYEEVAAISHTLDALKHSVWTGRHYALANDREFFAEFSETYFAYNDYWPYNRAHLMVKDNDLARAIAEIWAGTRCHE